MAAFLRLRVVAPAGPVQPHKLEQGLDFLRGRGHQVVEGKALRLVHGHLAGTDAQRAADLMDALLDPAAHAVWAARGGFGGLRLLEHLDWERLRAVPPMERPPLIGYSDLTSLQNALHLLLDWPCWHAPMVATELCQERDPLSDASLNGMLAALGKATHPSLLAAGRDSTGDWRLCSKEEVAAFPARLHLRVPGFEQILGLPAECVWGPGRAEALSVGGNLSVLTSLFGGRVPFHARARCLWLEDHGEYPFRLDRHLAQLANSGALKDCSALLLGSFLNCEEPDPQKSTFTAEELLRQAAQCVPGPVFSGLPFGHTAPRICLPFHGTCTVEAG